MSASEPSPYQLGRITNPSGVTVIRHSVTGLLVLSVGAGVVLWFLLTLLVEYFGIDIPPLRIDRVETVYFVNFDPGTLFVLPALLLALCLFLIFFSRTRHRVEIGNGVVRVWKKSEMMEEYALSDIPELVTTGFSLLGESGACLRFADGQILRLPRMVARKHRSIRKAIEKLISASD